MLCNEILVYLARISSILVHDTTELVCNLSFGGFLGLLDKLLWEPSGNSSMCCIAGG